MVDSRLWGGIDLGHERASVCITDYLGGVVLEKDVEAQPGLVFDMLKALPCDRLEAVGVEAGSGSHLVRKLKARGIPIVVLETRKASKILALRRHKTDTNDARGLADIVRLDGGTVTRVHQKSAESRRIRMQLTLRQQIVRQRVAGEHVIRGLLREDGGTIKRSGCATAFRSNIDAALAALLAQEGVDLRDEILPLLTLCESMRKYEERLDRSLLALARSNPICRRFMEVPGIGPIAALSFYSAVDDPHRFTRTEDVACFLGLTPRIRKSGKHAARPRISKMGNTMTRCHLTLSAEVLMNVCKKNSALRTQALKLKDRLGFRKARVALARKLSIVLLSLWKSGDIYQPEFSKNISV